MERRTKLITRGSLSRVPSFDDLGCDRWIGVDRDQHFPVLRICLLVGANPGSNGDDIADIVRLRPVKLLELIV
jgi:hypothetical protein